MKYLIVLFLLFSSYAKGQNAKDFQYWIEGRCGFLYLDLLEYPNSYGAFLGEGIFTSVNIIGKKKLWKGNLELGLGYSNFYYNKSNLLFTPRSPSKSYSNYLGIYVGYELYLSNWFYILTRLSSYISLDNLEKHQLAQRFYQNIELGLGIDIGKHFSLKLSSPITVFPMFYGKDKYEFGFPNLISAPWVEQTGGIISLEYRIK